MKDSSDVPASPDPVRYLTGRHTGKLRPVGIAMPGEGGRFTPDGCVQPWPGNTFICHIDPRSQAHAAMREMQEEVKKSSFHRFYAFLPPSSFHMTVFQGISPGERTPNDWPTTLPVEMELDDATAAMAAMVKTQSFPGPYVVRPIRLFTCHSLVMAGASDGDERALRAIRTDLRAVTGIQPDTFDHYVFHVTMAYLLEWVSDRTASEIADFSAELSARYLPQIGEVALGPVEFCTFDTMFRFDRVALLTGS